MTKLDSRDTANKRWGQTGLAQMLLLICIVLCGGCSKRAGLLVDAETGKPIPGATVVHAGKSAVTDSAGRFTLTQIDVQKPILVKAPGYQRIKQQPGRAGRIFVQLQPFAPQGAYIAYDKLGQLERGDLASRLRGLGFNTLVLDIKGDRGLICHDTQIELARQARPKSMPPIEQFEQLLTKLHEMGFYVIGRVVVFRDSPFAIFRPTCAALDEKSKKPWLDREAQCWTDPFNEEVWDYNISIAKEAAYLGVDEIVFDQVRFAPEGKTKPLYSKETRAETKKSAIAAFLDRAQRGLLEENVVLSVALNSWAEPNNTGLRFDELARNVDCICPRVLLSGSTTNFILYEKDTSELVPKAFAELLSQKRLEKSRLRPWFELPSETNSLIAAAQGQAAQQAGISEDAGMGWLLWNNAGNYEPIIRGVNLRKKAAKKEGDQ